MQILKTPSGNCNFNYLTGLYYHKDTPELAMASVLTIPPNPYPQPKTPVPPAYHKPSCGMYLFAQDSDSDVKTNPYGPNFKAYIEKEGLGTVTEIAANNPLHGCRVGILYVWKINQEACANWWNQNVLKR